MAVVRPSDAELEGLEPERPLMVDSDAGDNAHAILEIEAWCRSRGLARVRENWLRVIEGADGTSVRRGVCFRPSGDIGKQYADLAGTIDRRVEAMPETTSSVELLRGR